jgi:glutamate-ammonia-ligase adenylyltransferase
MKRELLTNHIVAGSPYLARLLEHHADFAKRAFEEAPEMLLQEICADLDRDEDLASHLRHKKAEAALLIAIADLSGQWNLAQVTNALTHFADASLSAAINFLLRDAAARGKLILHDQNNPSRQCGYVVLAMGKHGAHELNYSSDIDLIILYDPETAPLVAGVEPSTFFVKLTRALVTLLQDITSDGYVFRVDLRLRPDPRATQVAIALEAAAIYYENQGQNWERAAMIKARPVAGDIALGEEFLKRLTTYIWRKYLDYAAIADVQSLKRQIHAVKGHGEIAVQGHNLKLGRGGIREIEFFVQTQQLIAGGRNPKLRGRRTLDMLDALAEAQWITPSTAEEMKSAYGFLRTLEHRVQMLEDHQSHIVPERAEAFESYARFCGFENGDALSLKLRVTLETVQKHYVALFEDAGGLAGEGGSLVFTGGEDDPATIETLQQMGFAQASEVSATIRGWHFGRYAATRTARARELLTELMPTLLKTLAQSGEPDHTFLAFDNFLKGLPAGIQLFSMVKANPSLLDLIAQILGAAPRLAAQLSHQPRTLEAVVAPDFFSSLPSAENLARELNDVIPDQTLRDEAMDRARVLGRELMFRVGVRVLSETMSAEEAGQSYSMVADTLLQKLLAVTGVDMRASHGEVPQGQCAIIAMGKLGSREMTASSDLDLILVYDHAPGAEQSSGPKPISINQYYTRLTQRFVTAIAAPTAEGVLYEVDLRLRPSGSKGPVAVSLSSFIEYQTNSAWTWEKLALTRARVVAGPAELTQKLNTAIHQTLCAPRDPTQTRKDVADMRALMLREQKGASLWDIKRVIGGLVEVEFIAQYLQLTHAPKILNTNTHASLLQAQQTGALADADAVALLEAIGLYQRLTQLLRLCLDGPYDPVTAAKNLNAAICRAALMPDISATEALLAETQAQVSEIFSRIIGRA